MTPKEVLNYIDNQASSISKQVFSSVSTNKSRATRTQASQTVIKMAEQIINNDNLVRKGGLAYIQEVDLETFLIFADELNVQIKKSLKYKIFFAPFMGFWMRLLCYVYDLNYAKLMESQKTNYQDYYDAGKGVVLAGLYLALTEK